MDYITDEAAHFNGILEETGDGEELERAELLETVRSMQAELEILATLLKHHPEEP